MTSNDNKSTTNQPSVKLSKPQMRALRIFSLYDADWIHPAGVSVKLATAKSLAKLHLLNINDDYFRITLAGRLELAKRAPKPNPAPVAPKPAVSDYVLLAQVNAHHIMSRKDDLQDVSDFNALNILNQLEALWDFVGKLSESNLKQAERIAALTAKINEAHND